MTSFDVVAPAFTSAPLISNSTAWETFSFRPPAETAAPQSFFQSSGQESHELGAQDDLRAFGNVTPVPELSTCVAALLAAGVLLL